MCSITNAREKAITTLQNYLKGTIPPIKFIDVFPNVDDELLHNILNVFCEPLRDNPGMSSWEEVARISITAIKENWSPELLDDVLENGLP